MATYDPPNEILQIFNPENWIPNGTEALTLADADSRYLKLTGGVEKGSVTFNQGLVSNTVQGTNNNNVVVESLGTGDVILKTNNFDSVIVNNSGQVGIMTGALPIQRTLDVNGYATILGKLYTTLGCDVDGLPGVFYQGIEVYEPSNFYNDINIDNGVLYVDSFNNHVGIGTTTPSQALDVNGNAVVSGFVRIGSTLDVSGTTTLTNVNVSGTATMANIRMNPIKLGIGAGLTNQSPTGTIAFGFNAGAGSQDQFSIAIGHTAGNANQALRCIAIGHQAGQNQQQNDGVAIGFQAGNLRQNPGGVAIGYLSGKNTQGQNSVSIGSAAGEIVQAREAVAIGASAGRNTQGQNAIAIGNEAGEESQKSGAIALGYFSGNTNQGVSAVAIGDEAGRTNQGQNGISIGYFSGRFNQGANTVAIGTGAGQTNQGSTSVAIGQNAGRTNQHANSIVINASGLDTNTDGTSRTFIRPIRGVAHGLGVGVLRYDTTTFEITYSTN